MDLDTMLAEAAPARRISLGGPDSPAAVDLYQRIIAQPPAKARPAWRPRFAVPALAAVAAAGLAVIVALALTGGSPGHTGPGHRGGPPQTNLAAWSVVRMPDGVVRVLILQLRDPRGLWRMLRADGVPARVVFGYQASGPIHAKYLPIPRTCQPVRMPHAARARLLYKIMSSEPAAPEPVGFDIRPSAIPHGIGLFLVAKATGNDMTGGLSLQTDLVLASPQCTGTYP